MKADSDTLARNRSNLKPGAEFMPVLHSDWYMVCLTTWLLSSILLLVI